MVPAAEQFAIEWSRYTGSQYHNSRQIFPRKGRRGNRDRIKEGKEDRKKWRRNEGIVGIRKGRKPNCIHDFLRARHCAKHLTSCILFNLHNSSLRKAHLPFYRWENRDLADAQGLTAGRAIWRCCSTGHQAGGARLALLCGQDPPCIHKGPRAQSVLWLLEGHPEA